MRAQNSDVASTSDAFSGRVRQWSSSPSARSTEGEQQRQRERPKRERGRAQRGDGQRWSGAGRGRGVRRRRCAEWRQADSVALTPTCTATWQLGSSALSGGVMVWSTAEGRPRSSCPRAIGREAEQSTATVAGGVLGSGRRDDEVGAMHGEGKGVPWLGPRRPRP